MSERDRLLDRLVAVTGGDEWMRELFAAAPDEQVESFIARIEATQRKIARLGRLGAEWSTSGMRIERRDDG